MTMEIPVWKKQNMTVQEAASYSGIGLHKLYEITDDRNCELGNITPGIDIGNNYELNATPKFSKRKRLRSKNESANLKTCPTTNSSNKKGRSLSSSVNKNIQKKKLQLN